MKQEQYYSSRAQVAATFFPDLRPRDIGLYTWVYRNNTTSELRLYYVWQALGRPELGSCVVPAPGAEWEPTDSWATWVFPPTLEDVL